jgi:hypothetical protein
MGTASRRLAEAETTLTAQSSDAARARAEASFKEGRARQRRRERYDGIPSRQPNDCEKTARLTALRLAKEAAAKERAG